MLTQTLKRPLITMVAFVLAQAIILSIGWLVVYNATHERIAASVDGVIIDNNRRVAQSLVDAIGDLPDEFDPHDVSWKRAQSLVEKVDFGSGGFACILDEAGNIACHPELRDDPSLRGVNLGDHLITRVGNDQSTRIGEIGIGSVDVGVVDFAVDGKHYVATQTLTASGTRLLVHQPVSGLTAASQQVTAGLLARMLGVGLPVLILTAISGYAFIRAHSHAVHKWNRELESTVERRTLQLRQSRRAIVTALATLADYRDNETGQHVRRISEYTVVLSQHLMPECDEIDDAWIERIRLASMLHDIGKVGVPDAVLRKPGKLTEQEFRAIRSHPSFGADTLIKVHKEIESDPLIQMAIEISLYHHEKWDGSGYPVGLSYEDIPLSARITAVADVFDALMSPRVYKPAMPVETVREIITKDSGSHFDPRVVEAFEAALDELCRIRAGLAVGDAGPESARADTNADLAA